MSDVSSDSLAIEIKNLAFTYRNASEQALKGVVLRQKQGEFVGIMGATGAGKSTLCRCLNGLIPKFVRGKLEGELRILGESLEGKRVAELAQKVGMVFQDFEPQLFSTNVALEVAFGPANFGVPREEMVQRVRSCLEMVGLGGFEDLDPSVLSGGQKQRLAIASILAMAPSILVMDEPTTDLDPLGKQAIFDLMVRLKDEMATTVLAEHETEFMRQVDRIVILNQGSVVLEGPPAEILCHSGQLEAYGVRPLETVQLCERLHIEDRGVTLDEMEALLQHERYHFDPQRYKQLQARDQERKRSYGKPVIEVQDLSYAYGGQANVLEHVSFTIRQGEFVAILGQNGCGKTTLVKHFNGLLHPCAGSVKVYGRDTRTWKMSELGRKVGYVFQNPDHQIFAESVQEEVAFGPRNFGLSEEEVARSVAYALSATGLSGREQEDPFALPKGERQRLAVASVLASEPDIMVLDEPTTGLDYRDQCAVMLLVQQLNAQGHTTIIVTHTMWLVAQYAHRCLIMDAGQIIADEDTRSAFSEEERLRQISLAVPPIVELGNRLGGTTLSADELAACLKRGSR